MTHDIPDKKRQINILFCPTTSPFVTTFKGFYNYLIKGCIQVGNVYICVVSFTNTRFIFLSSCVQIQSAFGVIPDQLVISVTKCYHNNLFCGFDLWEHFDRHTLGHKSHSHSS
jgi:hypothetical protein